MRPSRILPALLAATLTPLLVASAIHAEVLPVRKTALVTIPSRMELEAPPARVWAVVCSDRGFGALTGFTAAPAAAKHVFSRLGDSIGASISSDKGRLTVTGFTPLRELRVTWEPENASYLCSTRIVLTKSAAGTTLEMWDRYSDDQPNVDETAKKVADATAQGEAGFRALVGKK